MSVTNISGKVWRQISLLSAQTSTVQCDDSNHRKHNNEWTGIYNTNCTKTKLCTGRVSSIFNN